MPSQPVYHFTDTAKLAILQARNEALYLGATAVAPQHLALGVLHTESPAVMQLLFPDPAAFVMLCRALGGTALPAPLIPEDIGYLDAARDALDGATRIAAAAPQGPDTRPVHILLGILRPWVASQDRPAAPDDAALVLAATGLAESRLRDLLPQIETLTPD